MGDDEKTACHYIVETYLVDDDKYRFGHTQIFFRAGQVSGIYIRIFYSIVIYHSYHNILSHIQCCRNLRFKYLNIMLVVFLRKLVRKLKTEN